jgi:hypothetical protein
MKNNVTLTIASLLSILFGTSHLTDDIIRGWLSGTVTNLTAVPVCVIWLYGTLVLAGRRSGYVSCCSLRPFRWSSPSST